MVAPPDDMMVKIREALSEAALNGSLDDLIYLNAGRRETGGLSTRALAAIPDDIPVIDYIENLPQIDCSVDYLTHEALLGADEVKDAQGNMFAAERFQSGNYSRIFLRKYAPDGRTLLGQWAVRGPRQYKIDGFGLSPAGPHVDVRVVAHDTPPDPRDRWSASGRGRIANQFVPFGNQLPKAGAENAAPDVPEGISVTPEEMRRIVREEAEGAIARWAATWVMQDKGVRGTIRTLAAEAIAFLTDPANASPNNPNRDPLAVKYQDSLFTFVTNAVAGVLYNLANKVDSWNAALHLRWQRMIREGLPASSDTRKEE